MFRFLRWLLTWSQLSVGGTLLLWSPSFDPKVGLLRQQGISKSLCHAMERNLRVTNVSLLALKWLCFPPLHHKSFSKACKEDPGNHFLLLFYSMLQCSIYSFILQLEFWLLEVAGWTLFSKKMEGAVLCSYVLSFYMHLSSALIMGVIKT